MGRGMMSTGAIDDEVQDYWLPLLKTDGEWDETKIRAELHDLVFVLNQVSEVYLHITGGKLSKPMYYADVIKAQHDDALIRADEEGFRRARSAVVSTDDFGTTTGRIPDDCAIAGNSWDKQA